MFGLVYHSHVSGAEKCYSEATKGHPRIAQRTRIYFSNLRNSRMTVLPFGYNHRSHERRETEHPLPWFSKYRGWWASLRILHNRRRHGRHAGFTRYPSGDVYWYQSDQLPGKREDLLRKTPGSAGKSEDSNSACNSPHGRRHRPVPPRAARPPTRR